MSKMPVILMFSGQGSQYYQMGKDLFETHSVFREEMQKADDIVRDHLGQSIIEEIYKHAVSENFENLLLSHPALVMTEYALYQVLRHEGIEVDQVWGSSVGEFTAGVVAGVWDLETALAMAIAQAQHIKKHCPPGGMLAVMATPELYETSQELNEQTTFVGINFPTHFSVAAPAAQLAEAEAFLKNKEIQYQRLPLQYAFHSTDIDAAKDDFLADCARISSWRRPVIPFISGMNGLILEELPREYFWEVVRQPLPFQEIVHQLEAKGPHAFVDGGPSGTLATFIKYNLSKNSPSKYFSIMTPFHRAQQQMNQLKEYLSA